MPSKTRASRARPTSSAKSTGAVEKVNATRELPTRTTRSTGSRGVAVPASAPELRQQYTDDQEVDETNDLPAQRDSTARRSKRRRKARTPSELEEPPHEEPSALPDDANDETQDTIQVSAAADDEDGDLGEDGASQPADRSEYEEALEAPRQASPALSGTTAHDVTRNSMASNATSRKTTRNMVDLLPELWDSSNRLVRLLTPKDPNALSLDSIVSDLKNEDSRRSRARENLSDSLTQVIQDAYGTTPYFDVQSISRELLRQAGVGKVNTSRDDVVRADEIFYMVNLAILVDSDVPTDGTGLTLDSLDFLNQNFPSPYLSDIGSGAGMSMNVKDTFKLALDIRIEFLKSVISSQSGQSDFNPSDAFEELFLETPGEGESQLRGWKAVPALHISNLNQYMKQRLHDRADRVRRVIAKSKTPQAALNSLMERYPTERFVREVARWAAARASELDASFKQRYNDVMDLQQALDDLSQLNSAAQGQGTPLKANLGTDPANAAKASTGKRGVKRDIRSNQNTKANRSKLRSLRLEIDDEAAQNLNRNKGKRGAREISATEGSLPTDQHATRRSQQRESRKTYMDTQPNAEKVVFESQAPVEEGSDYQPDVDGQSREEDDDDGDDEFQNDEREHIVSRRNANPKRTRSRSTSTERNRGSPSKRARTGMTSAAHQFSSEPYDRSQGDHSEQARLERMFREARIAQERDKPPRDPSKTQTSRTRRYWTQEEDGVLLAGLNIYGDRFDRFIRIQEKANKEGLLDGRTNIDLKDRARNLKFQHLNSGREIPDCLANVPLKKSDIQKLRSRGIEVADPSGSVADE